MSQGKGDSRRPSELSAAEYAARWERTFGKATNGPTGVGETERLIPLQVALNRERLRRWEDGSDVR